jgi:TRAP-type C4-dicarboxylate transport system substrate-binding protein
MTTLGVRFRYGVAGGGIAALAFAACLGLGASTAAAQPYTMKLAIFAIDDPLWEYIKEFKTRIEAGTNGQIKAELHPSARLGGIARMADGVLLGTIEMFATPPSFFKGADARFQVTDAPGLFDDIEHAQRTLTDPAFRNPYLAIGEAKGVSGVSLWTYGPTSYATLAPIRTLDDFRGKKIRVLATSVERGVMARVGAAGVPMNFAEVLGALQDRTIDGVRANIALMGASKFFAVTRYVTVVEDTMVPCAAMVSTAFLRKLPPDLRRAVETVGHELESTMLAVALRYESAAEALWRDAGGEVIRLSVADRAEFMRRARAVGDEVMNADPHLKPLYDVLKDRAEFHRAKARGDHRLSPAWSG